ncbi:hypothetical protein PIB30_082382 [Stylosanthes scabra]|uniref:Uncharacterized protein n=1 Tax=Stylosanthes scabra TaxID=79078 RepID=A0ABU6STD4_9FABA|nr:hypothetical protein [Stylosanthes scabra]
MIATLRLCVGSGAGWHVEVTFELVKTGHAERLWRGFSVDACWQGNFPCICVGLLCLCVGVKLVGESGSRLNMSKRELERELVGQGGFPRICMGLLRLCMDG